jgi:hypothetical protein
MANFVKIQSGNFEALVRPENLAKVEEKLAKVKPPVHSIPKPSARDRARIFPVYKPGMSTADYVRKFEADNRILITKDVYTLTGSHPLNCQPAAQYDPNVPLCVEDANPDYVPGVDDAPVKAKRARKAKKAAPDKAAVMWLLMDHGLTYYQANPLADKLITLFEGV